MKILDPKGNISWWKVFIRCPRCSAGLRVEYQDLIIMKNGLIDNPIISCPECKVFVSLSGIDSVSDERFIPDWIYWKYRQEVIDGVKHYIDAHFQRIVGWTPAPEDPFTIVQALPRKNIAL